MNQPSSYAVVLTGNLATFSQIQHAAQANGLAVVWGPSFATTMLKLPPEASVAFLIVDLSDDRNECSDVQATIAHSHPQAKLIAFGPHVHEARLQKAIDAGFHQVMARGRFFHVLGELFSGE